MRKKKPFGGPFAVAQSADSSHPKGKFNLSSLSRCAKSAGRKILTVRDCGATVVRPLPTRRQGPWGMSAEWPKRAPLQTGCGIVSQPAVLARAGLTEEGSFKRRFVV